MLVLPIVYLALIMNLKNCMYAVYHCDVFDILVNNYFWPIHQDYSPMESYNYNKSNNFGFLYSAHVMRWLCGDLVRGWWTIKLFQISYDTK